MNNPYRHWDQQYGSAFGVNPDVLSHIGRLESGHRPDAQNNWDSNAKAGTPSYGRMQFIQPTFNSYFQQAKQARPNVFGRWGEGNWRDPEQQTAVAAWAIRNGHGSAWATFDRARKAAGGQLYSAKNWNAVNGGGGTGVGIKKQGGQTITPGYWEGGPDTGKLKRINAAWAKHPEMAKAYSEQHIRQNPRKWVEAQVTGDPTTYQLTGNTGAALTGGSPNERARQLINMFGIRFDSNAPWHQNPQQGGGNHTAGSLHYSGQAIDIGNAANNAQTFNRLQSYVKQNPHLFAEAFHDPWGWYVKNGKIYQGSIGGHGSHIHLGFR